MGVLLGRQSEQRDDLTDRLSSTTKDEKRDMLNLQKREHDTEQEELNYLLKLEQDEELEKLRKVSNRHVT